jgi:hypothetical protein
LEEVKLKEKTTVGMFSVCGIGNKLAITDL